jgi:hypothetical protein
VLTLRSSRPVQKGTHLGPSDPVSGHGLGLGAAMGKFRDALFILGNRRRGHGLRHHRLEVRGLHHGERAQTLQQKRFWQKGTVRHMMLCVPLVDVPLVDVWLVWTAFRDAAMSIGSGPADRSTKGRLQRAAGAP